MKYVTAYNIQWDIETDPGNMGFEKDHETERRLPFRVCFLVSDDFDPENDLPDVLSDEFGLCVFGCSFTYGREFGVPCISLI